ncbi:MAG: RNA-binding cell elongation regulator Jag/EloR [Actinomycetes bacterium]
MEWVEVTAANIEQATESALRQLGVEADDAEVIIVSEPTKGLFGRMRGEARVKARVRPAGPRPKRNRNRRERNSERPAGEQRQQQQKKEKPATEGEKPKNNGGKQGRGNNSGRNQQAGERRPKQEEREMADGITLEEQAKVGQEFLKGLLDAYGYEASVEIRKLDDETLELAVTGEELGLLVGPRGTTLAALQDITRTVVQAKFTARTDRILVDVAQYRERRVAALRRWIAGIADEVKTSGEERALEPMSPADRKVIHDAVNEIEGVETRSEGEDARRYVVLVPSD